MYIKNKIRVAKFRVKEKLKNGDFPTKNNLEILLKANIDTKPYIKQFKENLDLLIEKSQPKGRIDE